MRGVEVPPPEADYTAEQAELYFDFAFEHMRVEWRYRNEHRPANT